MSYLVSDYPSYTNGIFSNLNNNYGYLLLTSNSSLSFQKNTNCDILIVGAGGRGGIGSYSGGGGAGEVIYYPSYTFSSNFYNIQIGVDSSITSNRISKITSGANEIIKANGGGDGASYIEKLTATNSSYNVSKSSSAIINEYGLVSLNIGNNNIILENNEININSVSYYQYLPILDNNPYFWGKLLGNNIDSSGNNYNFVNIGTPVYNTSSVSLSTSNYITLSADANMNLYTIWNGYGITISLWVKLSSTSGSWSRIFDFSTGVSPATSFLIYKNNTSTNIGFSISINSVVTSYNTTGANYFNNTWVHIVWSISSTGAWKIYINNVLLSSNLTRVVPNITYDNRFIGRSSYPNDGWLVGEVKDFRIYRSVLADSDVSELYTGRVDIFQNATIGGSGGGGYYKGDFSYKRYIPKAPTTLTTEVSNRIINGITCYGLDITLNSSGISYGSGTYQLYYSSIEYGITSTYNPYSIFNFNNSLSEAGGHFQSAMYNRTTGSYLGTKYLIDSNYMGDWIVIKFPSAIIMNKYKLTSRNNNSTIQKRVPKKFRIYGSNDGISWTILDDVNILDKIEYTNNIFVKEIFNKISYNYYCLTINEIFANNDGILNFVELEYYENILNINPPTINNFNLSSFNGTPNNINYSLLTFGNDGYYSQGGSGGSANIILQIIKNNYNSIIINNNYLNSYSINYQSYKNINQGTYLTNFNNGSIVISDIPYVKPWGAYFADDWSGTTLLDSSGNGRHATTTGTINIVTSIGNGASAPINYITGETSSSITWPLGSIPTSFTILSLTRYTGSSRFRILKSVTGNWLHGHHTDKRGVCYYDGWKTSQTSIGNLDDWLCCISKNSGTIPNNILVDGSGIGNATGGTGNFQLTINTGVQPSEKSDWALSCVIIYDNILTDDQMFKLNNYINNYKSSGNLSELKSNIVGDNSYPILKETILNYTDEREYPPKTFDSSTIQAYYSGDLLNIIPTNYIKQIINLNYDGITYGSGNYIIYSSSVVSSSTENGRPKSLMFDKNINNYGGWNFNYNSANSGYYSLTGTSYIKSDYLGDWIIIELPNPIILTKFILYTNNISSAPSLWRFYGSNDGVNWNLIIEASNDINPLISSDYINNLYQKILSPTITIAYKYLGFTINKVVGNDTTILIAELKLFGKEIDEKNINIINPSVWYKFDDPYNIGKDEMGIANMTNNNGTLTNIGIKGNHSVDFNGVNQYLSTITFPNLNNRSFSICCWCILESLKNWQTIFGYDNDGIDVSTRGGFHIRFLDNKNINMRIIDEDLNYTSATSFVNQIIFWCFTFDISNNFKMTIYQNGIQVATRNADGVLNIITNPTYYSLGRRFFNTTNEYANVRLDDFRVYTDKVFSLTDVQELYNGRIEISYKFKENLTLQNLTIGTGGTGATSNSTPVIKNNFGDGGDGNGGLGYNGVIIIKFPFENSIGNSNFSSNLLSINDKNIDFPYFNDINQKPSFCNICFSANYNIITNKPNLNTLSTSSNLYYSSNSFNTSYSNINYITSNNIINFNNNKLNNFNSSVWINSGLNIYSNLGSIGIGTSSFGNNKLIIKGNLKTDELNLKGNNISNIFITSNKFDNKSNSLYYSFSNLDYISRTKQITSSQFTTDSNKNLFINYFSNFSYYSNSFNSASLSSNSLTIPIKSQITFNYSNQSFINPGTYNVVFDNGNIITNYNSSITDKSYPILKDSSGININPTAWYKFDDITNIGLDSSGNGNHLTNNGSVSLNNTNIIKGIYSSLFNGTNNLQRAYTANLFSDQSGWSLSFWVYLKKPSNLVSLISTRLNDSSTLRGFNWYFDNSGNFGFQVGNDLAYTWYGGSYGALGFYTDDTNFKWFHLVLTMKSGEQRFYSNGVLITSGSESQIPNFQNGSSTFTIGSSSQSSYYVENGFRYDDVRYYGGGRILNLAQVQELYNGRIDLLQQGISYGINAYITGTGNTINITNDNSNYRYALFISNGTFVIDNNITCDILVVGGGGGGGKGGGGGGAGAILYITNFNLSSGTYSIAVGSGGSGSSSHSSNGTNGINSSITINGTTYIAVGGGGGGTRNDPSGYTGRAGNSGGSGGGGSHSDNSTSINIGGSSTKNTYINWTSLGNIGGEGKDGTADGYGSGGGGGAGSIGANAGSNSGGNGGTGINLSSIFGNAVGHSGWFGGGGGGGGWTGRSSQVGYANGGNGLLGGGGNAYDGNGIANTGGGGGGADYSSGTGGTGGSGVVIIRYLYSSSTIISNSNSLVLSSNSIVKFNYSNDTNINIGTYNVSFSSGSIFINSNFINDKSYPILKDISGNNINPIAWYKFDDTTNLGKDDTNTYNLINNNSVSYNSTNFVKGIGCCYFNGTNKSLTNSSAFNLNSKDFSISCWLYTTLNNSYNFFLCIGSSTATRTRVLLGYFNNNTYIFSFSADDLYSPVYTEDLNKWVHICATYKTGTRIRKIYRNGIEVASGTSGGETNSTTSFFLGKIHDDTSFYNGNIDDFRIYDKELTPNQIQELYKGRVDFYSYIKISSNIGIGTSLIGNDIITIAGNLNVNDFKIKNNSSSNFFITSNVLSNSSNNIINVFNSRYSTFNSYNWINSNSSIYLSSNGNIGVGSTNPKEKLDIFGNLNINGKILPNSCNSFDIGSSNRKFKELYLSGNSIYLDNTSIKNSNNYLSSSNININQITIRNNTNGINKTISLNSNGDFMINNKFLLGIDNRLQLSNIVFSNVFSNSFNNISNLNNSKFNSINSTDLIPIGSCNRFITNDIYNRPATFTGTIQSYNLITSNLNITGDTTTFNTTIYQTEQLFIANTYNYPAMILKQININKNVAEFYTSNLPNINASISGTGNIINTASDNINYKYALFTSNGTFTINNNISCDILVVGGGGGGGAGGGGAGGVVYRTNQTLSAGTYNINVGTGGTGGTNGSRGNDGNDSYIQLNSVDILRAYKGGGGGTNGQLATAPTGYYGSTGGCGHDSGRTQNTFPAGTLIGGNIGGVSSASPSGNTSGYQSSGGGGGAGGVGQVGIPGNNNNGNYGALGGAGGIGIQNSIIGISTYYAGGGGGGTNINSTSNSQTIRPQGGLGGGGNGNLIDRQGGTDGIANTGGGGGGSDWEFSSISGSGGSGVVIIRYLLINSTNQIRFVVNSNGNVGIGTINPISKLNVIGNINSTGLIINNNEITNVIKTNDSNYSNSVINSWNYSNNLYLSSSNSFLNISNSKQDLLKSSTILLGIGSNISNLNYSNFINRPDLSIYSSSVNSTSNLLYSNLSNIELNSSNTNISYINTNINNLVKFQWITNGNNVYTNSNVGIGSTIPTMSLDINGNLNTNELLIKKGNISNVFINSNIFEDRSNNYYSSFSNQDLKSSNSNITYINNVINTNLINLLNNADIWKNGTNYTLSIDYLTSITNNLNSLDLTKKSIATYNYSNSYNINSSSYDFNFYNGVINTSERPFIKPWGVYFANDWSGTTLLDSSGNGRHATTSGTITKTTASGNGSYGAITYISGGTSATISWPSGSIPTNYTIVSLTRYTAGSRGRILTSGININWLHGHHVSKRGVAYYDGWKTNATSVGNLDDWLCFIGKNSGSIPNNFLIDGVASGTASGGSGSSILYVNLGQVNGETSDWALSAVIIYDTQLTDVNMFKLNSFIENYKITGNLSLLKSNIFGITDNYYPVLKDVNGTDIIPTAWYKFDDITNLGIDSSGNGYNLTNYNSVGYNTNYNVYGTGSSSFNSANSRYLLGSAVNINGKSFSISFWVYPTSTSDIFIYAKDNSTAVRGALHIGYRSGTNFTFAFYGDDLEVTIANHENKWNFFTCTYNVSNNQQIAYVNGVLTASRTSGGSLNTSDQNYNIGRNFVGGNYFSGYLDDFRIYSGLVLTQAQITQLFDRNIDKSYPILKDISGNNINPIAWYKLDNNFLTTDSSGNNNNLVNVGTGGTINTTTFVKGDGSAYFNNTANYFRNTSIINYDVPISFAFWFNCGSANNTMVSYNDNLGNPVINFDYTGSVLIVYTALNTTWTTSPQSSTLNLNTWYHVVYTLNNNNPVNANLYINGSLVSTANGTANQTLKANRGYVYLGYSGDNLRGFNGYLDDFRFYNFSLSSTQVFELYKGRVDIYSSNLSSNILINSNVSFLDNVFSFGAGSYNNTLVSTNNSLVLSQNYIAKINYNNDININPGTYKAVFNNGTISFDETSYVRPWGAYFANDWSGTTLLDSSGNGRHATTTSGNITKITGSGNGASGLITYIYGGTGANISFPSGSIPGSFTILSLSRYNGGTSRRLIVSYGSGNWLHGHYAGNRGVCHYDTWKTNNANTGLVNDWLCCIGKNGGTNPNNILINGIAIGTSTGGAGSYNLGVNNDQFGETSDWALCCIIIFDSHLSDAYMVKLNNFINTYKTTGNLTELKSNILSINDKSYPVIKERQYPPKLYNSVSAETTTTEILGKTTYKQTLTLNTTGISYGSGDYIIYSSSVYTIGDQSLIRKGDLFNFNTGDTGGHWDSNYSTSTGYYTLSNFIKSGYIGDWIIIKLPVSIILTKFRFYHRTSYLSQAPSLWKCYGSIDGINFNEIVEASNDTISLTSSNYDSNRMYEKTLSASFNTFYNYIGFTFNRKINDASQAYFCFAELQLFGRETIDYINNPIAWYKFDDSTNLGKDEINNHNLTNNNSVSYNSSSFIKGIGSCGFNGTNQYLNKSSAFNLNSKDFSICFWINRTSNGRHDEIIIIGSSMTSSQLIDIAIYNTNQIAFNWWLQDFVSDNGFSDAGTWVHLCFTYKAGIKIKTIYRNGVIIKTGSILNEVSTTNDIRIGADINSRFFYGNLDDFRIYDFELSSNQVQELYIGRIDFYNINNNNDILNTNLLYSQFLNSTPNTLTLTSNSLVLSGNTLARFNYTNDVNINPGTYDINLNGGIGIGESPYVRPWGAYFADDWSGTTLLDSSGNSRHATTSSENITKITGSGNGATGNITYIYGGTSSTIAWPNGSIPTNFTILSLTRYNGASKGRILHGYTGNFLHGHWNAGRGICHYEYFLTPQTTIGTQDDWLCCIGKNGGTTPNNILVDGSGRGSASGGSGGQDLRINLGSGNWGEYSDWALSAIIIYDSHLSDAHMVKLNNFINTYKTTGNLAELKSNILRITNNSYPILKDRQYPPKLYDSSSGETTNSGELTGIIPSTYYKGTFTINSYTNGYGIGTYTIYTSSSTGSERKELFNFNIGEGNSHWGITGTYTQPDGNYSGSSYINPDYKGDWIIIKLPNSIILNRFSFQERSALTSRSPAEWKCYGSINGTNWIEITQASQMTRLTASNYENGFYTKSFFNSTLYLYIGFTFNKIVGGDANAYVLNFSELQLFGRETNDFINNPTLWYKFDDSSNIGFDSSGNGFHLTNNNSVSYNSVNKLKGTGSSSFNGVNQYLSSSTFSTNISQKSFSISYFQYAFSTTNGSTLYFGSAQYWLGYGVNTTGTYGFGGWSFSDHHSSAYNNDINNWVHVCFTYNVSTQSKKIYRNGVLIVSATGTTIYNITDNTFNIGSIIGAYFMNGLIDDFRLYNGMELSQSQILELYQGRVELYNYVLTSNYSSNLLIKGDFNIKGNIKLNNTSLNLTSSNVNTSITGSGNTINNATDNLYYNYAYFANTGTFTIDKNMICDILMVGGGGGGGYNHAGGGGAGAYYYGSLTLNSGTYNINIGAGGNGGTNTGIAPQNGGDTFISSNSIDLTINGSNVRCKGGGGAGMYNANGFIGNNGGCGGGGDGWSGNTETNSVIAGGLAINTGTIGKGFNGGSGRQFYNSQELAGGGGGGIGGAGGNVTGKEGGAGGNALAINITGSQIVIGGGGGGGEWPAYATDPAGTGGSATLIDGKIVKVGGDAVRNEGGSGGNGTTNTGSGGGAGKGGNGGNGGSGVVIIRYLINQTFFNGKINYSNIQNRPYMLDLLTSSNIINIGEENNINFPLSLTSWKNEWNLYIGNSPTNIPNSFIFHHLTQTFTTNVVASGGVINTASDNSNYKYAIFTGNGTFTIDKSLNCDILVVGGGGSGGQTIGGGGGGGAVVYIKNIVLSVSTYNIVVGAGGAQSSSTAGNKGSNSSFGSIIAEGGGGGVSYGQTFGGGIGGSGGGGGANESGVAIQVGGAKGTASSLSGFTGNIYGNIGGSGLTRSGSYLGGGGGGGAGEAGIDGCPNSNGAGGRGGNGILINITGSNLYWGAGGGGSQYISSDSGVVSRAGNGGLGGGGGGTSASAYYGSGGTGGLNTGGTPTSQVGGAGGANTGSGGGAGGWGGQVGGAGGSGVVIIRYSIVGVNSKWWFNGTTTTTKAEISDNRIKREIKDISNGLDMLMLINPKEYYLCDDKDYHKKYGIIAQDIYKIPELNHLVYKDEDYIANVYSFAFYYNSNGKYIISSLNPIIDLIDINDELKILLDNYNNQEIIIEELTYQNRYKKRFVKVKSIIDDYSFEIFEDIELNEDEKIKLFIYGKKINDFHKLDYNSLYTLNISANQDIYDIINNTYKTLDYLMTKVKNLENKLS